MRASGYALNNLNRGVSTNNGSGGKQGVKLENRTTSRRPILTMSAASVLSASGIFRPKTSSAATARVFGLVYLAECTSPAIFRCGFSSYLYAGQQITDRNGATPRLIDTDIGWAVRPLAGFQNLEFRVGYDIIADVQKHTARNIVYGAIRLAFDPAGFGGLRR